VRHRRAQLQRRRAGDQIECFEGRGRADRYLRGPLGRALRLRIAPYIHFQPDAELEQSQRLDELITRAVREDAARHPADDETPEDGSQ
jgi:ribosome-binding factor A